MVIRRAAFSLSDKVNKYCITEKSTVGSKICLFVQDLVIFHVCGIAYIV